MRHDNRQPDQLRPVKITRGFTSSAPGSVLIQTGRTTVLCTASVQPQVPAWMAGQARGWVTAEYAMLQLARTGIRRLTAVQREALGDRWPILT